MRKTELGFKPLSEINQVSSPVRITPKGDLLGSWWKYEQEDGVYFSPKHWWVMSTKVHVKNYKIKTEHRKADLHEDMGFVKRFKKDISFFRPKNIQ